MVTKVDKAHLLQAEGAKMRFVAAQSLKNSENFKDNVQRLKSLIEDKVITQVGDARLWLKRAA